MAKQWPGTQTDTYQNTSNMKPVPSPCDGRQFAENPYDFDSPENYDTPRFDSKFNQETVNSKFHSENATAGEGQWGGRQYSDFQQADGYSGYGVEQPYGTGPGFARADVVTVDNGRADRGRDS